MSPDVEQVKLALEDEFLNPYKLEMPAHVLKPLVQATKEENPTKRAEYLEVAKQKAHMHYLAKWAQGVIRVKDENAPPMPDDVKAQLRELNEKRREEKKAEREASEARRKELDKADLEKDRRTVAKKSKKPVFDDPETQKLVVAKYSWVIPGTFRQDPDKPGGTNLDIKCQACGMSRTIHLADAFQVKFCTGCKSSNAKTKQAKVG